MEQIVLGDLVCLRIPQSRTLRSLVEREVSEWVKNYFEGIYPKGIQYKVTLERVHFDYSYRCDVQIYHKNGEWIGEQWGKTPEEALRLTLAQMKQLDSNSELGLKSIATSLPKPRAESLSA